MTDKRPIFEQYIDREESFVIPLEKLTFCEKHGNRFLQGLLGALYYKRRYVKMGLTDGVHGNTISNYCIYSVNPRRPFNSIINIEKLYKEIITVMEIRSTYRIVTSVKSNIGAPFISSAL